MGLVGKMGDAESCVFCRIARGEFGTEFVAESENAVAFRDLDPKAPVHVLVVPKAHIVGLHELSREHAPLAGELLLLAAEVARKTGIEDGGYRVLTNVGPDAGQTVFHLHFHVMGGHKLSAGLG